MQRIDLVQLERRVCALRLAIHLERDVGHDFVESLVAPGHAHLEPQLAVKVAEVQIEGRFGAGIDAIGGAELIGYHTQGGSGVLGQAAVLFFFGMNP